MLTEFIFNHASLVRLQTRGCLIHPDGKASWKRLKELELRKCALSNHAVYNILDGSPVLESLVLDDCFGFDQLVIVSKFLKKLELYVHYISVLDISCPNLEELCLAGFLGVRPIELMNFSSLNHASLDFEYEVEEFDENLPRKFLQQLQHVKELKFGNLLLEVLGSLEVQASRSPPLLNNRFLTLDCPHFDDYTAGIAYALRCSHLLEKLVIDKKFFQIADASDLENFEGDYWSSNKTAFNCLVSHLKFVDITNFSKRDLDYKHMLNFIGFLLKNAEVLEKLVVVFENSEKDFMLEVSLKLLSFPRCSKHATIEFSHLEQRI